MVSVYALVSAEGLEFKSHSSLYILFFPFPSFLALSCLPPQPLTPSTPDLYMNHIIRLCKPKENVDYIVFFCFFFVNSYLISLVCLPLSHPSFLLH